MGHERRVEDPEYWCKRLASVIDVLQTAGVRMAVVDDIRFPNEIATLRLRGAFLVRVEPHDAWTPGRYADSPSETALDSSVGWDYVARPCLGPEGIRQAANEILFLMCRDDDAQAI
jgi:hypothetical protein